MRFSKALRDLGDEFRRKFLDSTDEKDKTVLEEDWKKMTVSPNVYVLSFKLKASLSGRYCGLAHREIIK